MSSGVSFVLKYIKISKNLRDSKFFRTVLTVPVSNYILAPPLVTFGPSVCPQNELLCVGWDVKPYSLTPCCLGRDLVTSIDQEQ